jgi:hypothetical protein
VYPRDHTHRACQRATKLWARGEGSSDRLSGVAGSGVIASGATDTRSTRCGAQRYVKR